MLKSMTGFSRNRIDTRFGAISLEISSVNHRNQEITVKTPRELSLFEQVVQQGIRTASRRGKVQARLEICWDPTLRAARIDPEVLKGYVGGISRISKDLGFQGDVAIEQLLSLPGVIVSPQDIDGDLENDLGEAIADLLGAGISQWDLMRSLEGSHLQQEITDHLERFHILVLDIGARWAVAKDIAAGSLKERIRLLLDSGGFECDEGRIAQEIIILNDKWDIAEEMARLASHVDKFRGIVHNDVVSGKTLDFLVQEMNREINTIASKVQDADIRWVSVEAKSALESIREQIQNVE
ncbi:MAG: YicC/YloC family endoribonuclease [Thermovirgaceae bacterium]|nr:YicC/YloC family endoribonuclease [Thermovirgaceae bacterium]